jgi:hypothetical protein
LVGLVYGCTVIPTEATVPLIQRPMFWAVAISLVFVVLNVYFW